MTDDVNRVHPDEIEDEQTLRMLRSATNSDAVTVEINGQETELVKSAATDNEVRKAVDRTKSKRPDPTRDRLTALAEANDVDPHIAAEVLNVPNADAYKSEEQLAKEYRQNPLKNRAAPLEKHKQEAYNLDSSDDSDDSGPTSVLRHDGTVDTFYRAAVKGTNGSRRIVTAEGEIELADKLAIERPNGKRDVGYSFGSDEIEKAARRPDERVLFVERGWHPGY